MPGEPYELGTKCSFYGTSAGSLCTGVPASYGSGVNAVCVAARVSLREARNEFIGVGFLLRRTHQP